MSPTVIQTLHADDKIVAYTVTAGGPNKNNKQAIQESSTDDTHYIPSEIMVDVDKAEFKDY